jgi:hypothetical protein
VRTLAEAGILVPGPPGQAGAGQWRLDDRAFLRRVASANKASIVSKRRPESRVGDEGPRPSRGDDREAGDP